MSKREGELKSLFGAEFKRQLTGFYMLHYATAGAPDRTIVGAGRQTNWEMKHGTPDFVSPGNQELLCCRLAQVAHCRYVVWYEHRGRQKTMIVHPEQIRCRTNWQVTPEASCTGFDMRWLVEQIRKAHHE